MRGNDCADRDSDTNVFLLEADQMKSRLAEHYPIEVDLPHGNAIGTALG